MYILKYKNINVSVLDFIIQNISSLYSPEPRKEVIRA